YRVSPNEVETIFQATGLLSEVVALGVPHPVLGQSIVLIAVTKDGQEVSEEQLINRCKKQLTSYMIPNQIIFRRSMPTNPHGKLDRKLLAKQLLAEEQNQWVDESA
ncbi:MAG: class I adenylate-forming enzyme family protein, partial [Candidatus Thiodiazotropha sp.]